MADTTFPTLKGFLKPFSHDYSNPAQLLNGLVPSDFEKVRLGYACAHCLAEFSTYIAACPLCGEKRDIAKDIQQGPSVWQDDFQDLTTGGEKTVARTAEEAIRDLQASPDVEHIPLEGLKRRNRSAR